jgi:hypothetical protein
LKTISFVFFALPKLHNAYFYYHPQDDLPRVRGSGVSIWIDSGGQFSLYFVQDDSTVYNSSIEEKILFSSDPDIAIDYAAYTTYDPASAVKLFECIREKKLGKTRNEMILENALKSKKCSTAKNIKVPI